MRNNIFDGISDHLIPEESCKIDVGQQYKPIRHGWFCEADVTKVPTDPTDVVNKAYVDAILGVGITVENIDMSVIVLDAATIEIDQASPLVLSNPAPNVARLSISADALPALPDGSTQYNNNGAFGGGAPIHVEAFTAAAGCIGGTGVNGASIQCAINAAPSGGAIQLEANAYDISDISTILINKPLTFRCTNPGQAYVPDGAPTTNSHLFGGSAQTMITVNTNQAVVIEDCQFTIGLNGIGVLLTGPQANAMSKIHRNGFYGGSYGIVGSPGKTIGTTVRDNLFYAQDLAGTLFQGYVSGGNNCDGGGYTLDNNYFAGTGGTDAMKFVNSAAVAISNNQAISYDNALTITTTGCSGPGPGQYQVHGNQLEIGAGSGHAVNVVVDYPIGSMEFTGNFFGTTFGTNTDVFYMQMLSSDNFANILVTNNNFANAKRSSIHVIGAIAGSVFSNNALAFATTSVVGTTHTTSVVDGIASTANLAGGMSITGSGIPAGATILTVDTANQITLSVATTSSLVGITLVATAPALRIESSGYGVLVTNNTVLNPVPNHALYSGAGYTLVSNYNRDGQELASLPAAENGSSVWCEDCQSVNSVCQTGGTGTIALRRAGSWQCYSSGETFVVDGRGANVIQATIIGGGTMSANLALTGNDALVPTKFIRAHDDQIEFLNNAYNAVLFRASDSGDFFVPSLASASNCITTDGAGKFIMAPCGGGGSAPGGVVGSAQFNDTGVLGGSSQTLHVKAFGTNRAAIQAAITAAPVGGAVQLECIDYTLDGTTITIPKALTIRGCGSQGGGVFTPAPSTSRVIGVGAQTVFTIDTLYGVTIQDLVIVSGAGGTGVFITATGTPPLGNLVSINSRSKILNTWIEGGAYGIRSAPGKAAETTVETSYIANTTTAGMWFRGLLSPLTGATNCDGGGYRIISNTVETQAGDGYLFENTAALYFTGNATAGALVNGLHMVIGPVSAPCSGPGPTQNQIVGNQITGFTGSAVLVEAFYGTGSYEITDNWFGAPTQDVVHLVSSGGGFIFGISYANNTHQTVTQVGKGAVLLDGVTGSTVSGNVLSMGSNITNYAFKSVNTGYGVIVSENSILNPIAAGSPYQGTGYTLVNHMMGNANNFPLAGLPAVLDGSAIWCSDCQTTNPCTGSGGGAQANRVPGNIWNCGATGVVGGAAAEIAVFTAPGALTGYTHFVWDQANDSLLASPNITITPSVVRTAVLSSDTTIISGANITSDLTGVFASAGAVIRDATLATIIASNISRIDRSSGGLATGAGLVGGSTNSSIYGSTQGVILGSANAVIGGTTAAGVPTAGTRANNSVILSSSDVSINGALSALVAATDGATIGIGALDAAVIGGTNGSIAAGVASAVSINGGIIATNNTTAIGGTRLDIAYLASAGLCLKTDASGTVSTTACGSGSGTVTSIATTAPITGGTITTTGTIGITDFVASGASHARGAVPDPGGSAGTTKFLREDATWAVPAGGGNVTAGGTLTLNQLMIGQGTTATATLGSLGTTTTVLHGNAGGAPTFGAVANADLTNSSVTYNGKTVALGASATLTLASADFANQGTTTTVLHGNASGNPSFGAIANADLTNSSITVTGTADRVTVTGSPVSLGGTVTLSGPQDIATGSSPTFVGLTLSGLGGGGTQMVTASNTGVLGVQAVPTPTGLINVRHTFGSSTAYQASANTDAARGTALLAALAAAVTGDTIQVGPGTYDITTNRLDLSLGATGNVNLVGSGQGVTIIKTAFNSSGPNTAVVRPGLTDSLVADLTLQGTAAAGSGAFQFMWGVASNDSGALTNAVLRNATILSAVGTDCLYLNNGTAYTVTVKNVTCSSAWDAVYLSGLAGSVVNIYDSSFTTQAGVGITNSGAQSTPFHLAGLGTVNVYNSTVTALADASGVASATTAGFFVDNSALTLNVYDTQVIATGSNGAGAIVGGYYFSANSVIAGIYGGSITTSATAGTTYDVISSGNSSVTTLYATQWDNTKTSLSGTGTISALVSQGGGNTLLGGLNADTYLGKAVVLSTPVSTTLHGVGGLGSNKTGADLTLAGGKGTGNSTGLPGSLFFATSTLGGSATTLQSLTNRWQISGPTPTSGNPGDMLAVTDGAVNIGAVGANRPDKGFFKTSITAPSALITALTLTEEATPALSAAGTAVVYANSTDHKIYRSNNGGAYAPISAPICGTQTILPGGNNTPIGNATMATPTTAGQINCVRFLQGCQAASYTKLAARVPTGVASAVCQVGIYNVDASAVITRGTVQACTTATIITDSGMTPFTLESGTEYNLCVASSATATLTWAAISLAGTAQLFNNFTTSVGQGGTGATVVAQFNAACTSASTPYTCCTGTGTGTCVGLPTSITLTATTLNAAVAVAAP